MGNNIHYVNAICITKLKINHMYCLIPTFVKACEINVEHFSQIYPALEILKVFCSGSLGQNELCCVRNKKGTGVYFASSAFLWH